jgi:hypothetical protein
MIYAQWARLFNNLSLHPISLIVNYQGFFFFCASFVFADHASLPVSMRFSSTPQNLSPKVNCPCSAWHRMYTLALPFLGGLSQLRCSVNCQPAQPGGVYNRTRGLKTPVFLAQFFPQREITCGRACGINRSSQPGCQKVRPSAADVGFYKGISWVTAR